MFITPIFCCAFNVSFKNSELYRVESSILFGFLLVYVKHSKSNLKKCDHAYIKRGTAVHFKAFKDAVLCIV